MRTVGVFSIKGGVGKTASAVNLAYLASRDRYQTLLWDLDPQAASSFYLRVKPRVRGGVSKLLEAASEVSRKIRKTDHPGLDLLPADTSYRKFDLILDELKSPKRGVMRLLKPLTADYDLTVLDCPPALSLLSENIFRASQMLIVPVIPTTLSVRTLEQLFDFLKKERIDVPVRPFFTMVDRRKKMHTEIVETLPKEIPGFLKASIPYASVIEQMGEREAPVGAFARWTDASEAYERLWSEIKRALRRLN